MMGSKRTARTAHLQSDALRSLKALPAVERGAVLCWFCDACHEHIGPGETHKCKAGSLCHAPAEGYERVREENQPELSAYGTKLAAILGIDTDTPWPTMLDTVQTRLEKKVKAFRKQIVIEEISGRYRLEIHVGSVSFVLQSLFQTREDAEDMERRILASVVADVADDLDEADKRARGMARELGDALQIEVPHETDEEIKRLHGASLWSMLLTHVRDLKRVADQKLTLENIIHVLQGAEVLSSVIDRIELQLSDEAVYDHLTTCAEVLDDADQKRMLMDAAELFADEFCNQKG